jgi:hypothetical protein
MLDCGRTNMNWYISSRGNPVSHKSKHISGQFILNDISINENNEP